MSLLTDLNERRYDLDYQFGKTSQRLLVGIGAGSSRLVISYLHIEYYVELIGSYHLQV